MKNRICLILPYVGKFHNYFELFLHSIYRNKDILDLLILIPDSSTPELKTEITFKIPENVFIKEVSFIEADIFFSSKLSQIFDTKIELLNNDKFSIVKKFHNLCHYKGLYNLWAKDFLKDYSHWGWTDCDLILGNILEFYPNALELSCVTDRGHFAFLINEELPSIAFRGEELMTTERYNKAYNYFVKQDGRSFMGDENWTVSNVTRFYGKRAPKKTPRDLICKSITPLWKENSNGKKRDYNFFMTGNGKLINTGKTVDRFVYNNGNLYTVCENVTYPTLYAHFFARTNMCNNTINVGDYKEILNFEILPPLTFNTLT